MDILGRINQLNNERDWNYYRLSVVSGIPQSTISGWYTKNMLPTVANIEKLCEAYGITLAQFFMDSKDRLDLTEEQTRLLRQWDTLSKQNKERIFTIIAWMQDSD